MKDRLHLLFDILDDLVPRADEKHDAIIELIKLKDERSLRYLLEFALNLDQEDYILDSIGEAVDINL